MPRRRRHMLLTVLLALSVLGAACGGEDEVGTGISIDPDAEGNVGALRDTTTSSPPTTEGSTDTTAAPTDTTAAPAATTTTAPPVVNVVKIQDDEVGAYFDPQILQVPRGQVVRFQNTGTKTRSIVLDDGSWNSGDIAPGASADYLAGAPGTFSYTDGSRPYAVGQIQVF